jgi:hypothetical protein
MTFEQMNEPTPEQSSVPNEPQTDEEFGGDADLGGDAGKSKKNMMLLGGLAVVAVAVVWFVFFRGAPQAAQAALPADGGTDIKQFLDSGNINLMKQTLKDTEKVVQQFRTYPAQTQIPLSSLRSNPFRELAPKSENVPVARNADDDEAKEHAKVVTAVADLHLQSIVRGGKYHACMINNTLYQQGQQIGMFTVEQVDAGTVVLASGKYRFELKMQN